MSHSCRAGKHSLRPSNVSSLRCVLFKLSLRNSFIAILFTQCEIVIAFNFVKCVQLWIAQSISYTWGERGLCRWWASRTDWALAGCRGVRWWARGPRRRTWSTTSWDRGARAAWWDARRMRSSRWWRPSWGTRGCRTSPTRAAWRGPRPSSGSAWWACAVRPSFATRATSSAARTPSRTCADRRACCAARSLFDRCSTRSPRRPDRALRQVSVQSQRKKIKLKNKSKTKQREQNEQKTNRLLRRWRTALVVRPWPWSDWVVCWCRVESASSCSSSEWDDLARRLQQQRNKNGLISEKLSLGRKLFRTLSIPFSQRADRRHCKRCLQRKRPRTSPPCPRVCRAASGVPRSGCRPRYSRWPFWIFCWTRKMKIMLNHSVYVSGS